MQIQNINSAATNSQGSVSVVKTKHTALADTQSALEKMRALAVRATSDTLTLEDRRSIQSEVDELREEIDDLAVRNAVAAESKIQDAEMARGVMDGTKKNILARPGDALAAQANQSPRDVLDLIKS